MRKQKSTVTLLALALVLAFGAVPVMAAEDMQTSIILP